MYDLPKQKKVYERPDTARSAPREIIPVRYSQQDVESKGVDDLPETRDRRLLELKLLLHYTSKTCFTVGNKFIQNPSTVQGSLSELWRFTITEVALQHEALLNAIYAISALHLAKTNKDDVEALAIYPKYLDLALRDHRKDVEVLSKANADVVCMTASVIRLIAFALLQDRSLEPYAPPVEWLEMSCTAGGVFYTAWEWISDDENSLTMALLKHSRVLWDSTVMFKEENRAELAHLLGRTPQHAESEPWDESIQEAYDMAIRYIGGVVICINNGEPSDNICRRLIAFPIFVPRKFIDLVEDRQPRALLVMAHFFALLGKLRDIWWVGDIGRREVAATQAILPEEWQDLMQWPLKTVEEKLALG